MKQLMHAREARKIVNEALDQTALQLKEVIATAVHKAVDTGGVKTSLNIPTEHHDRMRIWLIGLGYKVDSGTDQRDGAWFTVSW